METQNLDYKEKWDNVNDEKKILQTLCAFANTNGGSVILGVNDKTKKPVGVDNIPYLLDLIPKKCRDILGVISDVKVIEIENQQCIEVKVAEYPSPISYQGRYYIRSGSDKTELSGNALNEFLLRKQGLTWDGLEIPDVKIGDLDPSAIKYFRQKSVESKRLTKEFVDCSDEVLLEKLNLIKNGKINRAGVLLFHEDPEKFCIGAYVKVGYFENELKYHDIIGGCLIKQPDKVVDLIFTKYLKGAVSFKGIQRIETFPAPYDAMREIVLNAIAHRDYRDGNPVQIKVYPDKIYVFGVGGFPREWTIENLLSSHKSQPCNPHIAQTFFRAGFVDSWGSGMDRIKNSCDEEKCEFPTFEKLGEDLTVIVSLKNEIYGGDVNGDVNGDVTETQMKIITEMKKNPKISIIAISKNLDIPKKTIENNIKKLKEKGIITRKGSDKTGEWIVEMEKWND